MTEHLARKVRGTTKHPPVWCWHSCEGTRGKSPTVGTASLLLSSYEIQQGVVAVELLVPSSMILLSSYHLWNEFMDYVLTMKRLPMRRHHSQRMFDEPLITHPHDDIQAVVPFIDPTWIERVFDLVGDDRGWDEGVFD